MSEADNRIPFRATTAAVTYEAIRPLPVRVLLENVRSLYNVGSFFRTADSAGIEKLLLAGITGYPPQNMISKTALGAEDTVAWEHTWTPDCPHPDAWPEAFPERRYCRRSGALRTSPQIPRALSPDSDNR
jgi:hypothetical protein